MGEEARGIEARRPTQGEGGKLVQRRGRAEALVGEPVGEVERARSGRDGLPPRRTAVRAQQGEGRAQARVIDLEPQCIVVHLFLLFYPAASFARPRAHYT